MSKKVLIISSDVESYEIAKRMAKVAHFDLVFVDSIDKIKLQLSGSKELYVAIHLDVNVGQIDLEVAADLIQPYAFQIPVIIRTSMHGNTYEPLERLVSSSYMVLHGNSLEELTQSLIRLDLYCGFLNSHQNALEWADVRDGNDEFLLQAAVKASKSDLPVLIEGLTGTPKAEMAAATHKMSNRYRSPMMTVDAGSYSLDKLLTVLFGDGITPGLLKEADRGTLFINNLNQFSGELQKKLLNLLEGGVAYLAEDRSRRKVDVKLIIATDLDLIKEIKSGALEEAFYYRVSVSPIVMRKFSSIATDMRDWMDGYINSLNTKLARGYVEVTPDALDALARFDWPGQHKQFSNVLAWVLSQPQNSPIEIEDLPQFLNTPNSPDLDLSVVAQLAPDLADFSLPIHETGGDVGQPTSVVPTQHLHMFDNNGDMRSIIEVEEELIRRAIAYYDGKMSFVARQLGIGRSTLYRKLKEYQIDPDHPLECVS
jgi:DNA-binding NtrC family response regulator